MEVTRRLRVGCEFIHQSEIAVPAVFQVEPLSDQKVDVIDERWSLEPDGPTHPYSDLYGNPCRRLSVPAGRSVISYQATVIVPDAVEDVDEEAPELTPRSAARRDADLYASQPLLPSGCPRRRSLEPLRQHAARVPSGPGDLRSRARSRPL